MIEPTQYEQGIGVLVSLDSAQEGRSSHIVIIMRRERPSTSWGGSSIVLSTLHPAHFIVLEFRWQFFVHLSATKVFYKF